MQHFVLSSSPRPLERLSSPLPPNGYRSSIRPHSCLANCRIYSCTLAQQPSPSLIYLRYPVFLSVKKTQTHFPEKYTRQILALVWSTFSYETGQGLSCTEFSSSTLWTAMLALHIGSLRTIHNSCQTLTGPGLNLSLQVYFPPTQTATYMEVWTNKTNFWRGKWAFWCFSFCSSVFYAVEATVLMHSSATYFWHSSNFPCWDKAWIYYELVSLL